MTNVDSRNGRHDWRWTPILWEPSACYPGKLCCNEQICRGWSVKCFDYSWSLDTSLANNLCIRLKWILIHLWYGNVWSGPLLQTVQFTTTSWIHRKGGERSRGESASSTSLHPYARAQADGARGTRDQGHGLEVAWPGWKSSGRGKHHWRATQRSVTQLVDSIPVSQCHGTDAILLFSFAYEKCNYSE